VRAVNPSLVLVHQLVLALKRVVTTVDRLVISLVVVRILALKVKRGKKLTVLALSSVVASTVESEYLGANSTIQICIHPLNIYVHYLILL